MSETLSFSLLKVPLALALVVVLIVLVGVFLRRYGPFASSAPHGRHGHRRLTVQAGQVLDGKRRLLLVKRDNVEHLLLLGGPNDLVVEANITPPQGQQQEAEKRSAKDEAGPPLTLKSVPSQANRS